MTTNRLNLQDLADELGLARSTVSRALRDDPLIAADTRRRVKEAAERLGYRSNPYVSVLMSRVREGAPPSGSPVIAFINPQQTRDGWRRNRPVVVALNSAAERARELGFDLQEFWLGEPGMTAERLTEILLTRGIRAIILGAPGRARDLVPFNTDGFAAVAVDLEPARKHLHRATTDYLGNTTIALQSLRALGYRRIGLAISRDIFVHMHHLPRMAFLDFEEGLPRADRTGCWIGDWDDLPGFARWLVDAKPDALVTINVSPQGWLQPLGFRIPQDIGVAQLDPHAVDFPLSGINGRFDVVGRNAMNLLVSQIHHNEFSPPRDPMHVVTTGEWQSGGTTCDRNNLPSVDPYDDVRLAICRAAAEKDFETLHVHRRRLVEVFYSEPFKTAAAHAAGPWRCLSLAAASNAPLCQATRQPKADARHPIELPSGRQVMRGVPFEVPPPAVSGPHTVIAFDGTPARDGAPPPASTRTIPVDGKARAFYFLHAASFVSGPTPVARYDLVYADDRRHTVDLLPYWPPHVPAEVACIHDTWSTLPQIETDKTRSVFVPSRQHPFVRDRFVHAFELRNPHPGRVVARIECTSLPESGASLVVIAVTALQVE